MAYDPNKPANASPINAAELRTQFAGLNAIIAATGQASSNNSNGVAQLGFSVSDPPQADVQTIANKLDELIAALRR